jgi:hypothetical protein
MQFSIRKKSLPALAGGIENEYGMIFPGIAEPCEGGTTGFMFCQAFSSSHDKEIAALGGSLDSFYLNRGLSHSRMPM